MMNEKQLDNTQPTGEVHRVCCRNGDFVLRAVVDSELESTGKVSLGDIHFEIGTVISTRKWTKDRASWTKHEVYDIVKQYRDDGKCLHYRDAEQGYRRLVRGFRP